MAEKQNDDMVYSFTVTSACIIVMLATSVIIPAYEALFFGMVFILQLVRAPIMYPPLTKVTGSMKYFFIAFIDALLSLYCISAVPTASQFALVIPLIMLSVVCMYRIRVDTR